jgi:tRNA (guanine37-N1)-methyltransferase
MRENPEMVKARALVVVLSKGQTAVNTAQNMRLIDHSLRIFSTGNELCIPLVRPIDESEASHLSEALGQIRIVEREFYVRSQRPRTLTEVVKADMPPRLLAFVPKSFDVIGRIAVIELPDELIPFGEIIGAGVLEICSSVRTVMAKAGVFSSDYRTRELRLIAGEDNSITCYKEHGCTYELDVRTVFFSTRLGHERLRIASQVKPGETVVDMFAGVGPYSILVARKQPLSTVYAVDANPAAFKFLVSNVLANRVLRIVTPMMGDIREVVSSQLSGVADRLIMNLPGDALDFIDVACSSLSERGGVIHFYSFESAENPHEAASEKLKRQIEASGRKLESILAVRTVKEVAPYRFQVAIDARVS